MSSPPGRRRTCRCPTPAAPSEDSVNSRSSLASTALVTTTLLLSCESGQRSSTTANTPGGPSTRLPARSEASAANAVVARAKAPAGSDTDGVPDGLRLHEGTQPRQTRRRGPLHVGILRRPDDAL